jgi:hypothetical protein
VADLKERVAKALGWSLTDVNSMSMQSLREMVRQFANRPDLVAEMDHQIRSGEYICGTQLKKPRRRAHAAIAASLAAGSRDVTSHLLNESSNGPGEQVRRVATAKPAKSVPESLVSLLDNLRARDDNTMGFISKPLAYSKLMPPGKRDHANLIRLIKGGHVHVCEVAGAPPDGSTARRDAPYGDRYYVLHVGPCGR